MRKTMENGATVLTADAGMRLTNDTSYVTTVRLGKEDSGESWYEITDAEYEEILAMQNPDPDPDVDIAMLREKAAAYDILTGVAK